MDKIKQFIEEAKKSHFYYSFYSADIDIEDFLRAIMFNINRPMAKEYDKGNVTTKELVDEIYRSVPEFQRSNDKWTSEMQSSYVSNILQGCKASPIMLYTVAEGSAGKSFCQILDGLQRITAMIRFFTDPMMEVKAGSLGPTMTSGELLTSNQFVIHLRGLCQSIKIYDFNTEIEAVEHYICINENISHSSEDINRAKSYLEKLKKQGS